MRRMLLWCWALVASVALSACVGDELAQPRITSFTASADAVPAGSQVELTAVFSNGTAVIDQGVGSVTSGVPIPVRVDANTVFTLTVTNPQGDAVTQTVQVGLAMVSTWNFDSDAPGWVLSADPEAVAEVRDGMLLVSASQYAGDGSCYAAGANLVPDDARFQAAGYATAEYLLDFRYAYGTGMGYPRVRASYAGRSINFVADGLFVNTPVRVVFDTVAGKVHLQIGSEPVQTFAGDADAGPAGIWLSANACAADLESEDLALDALTIEAR